MQNHIKSNKINTQNLQTNRWFKELVDELNMSHYLTDARWSKYWEVYHENK